ncbi:helix-turn-helix transcriptional regulator [Cohnella cholangitidis]|uniref:YafY family transcriptional regulator n=1 Tax=Cohnella cholangitidis TaxID=2598458 RepID=A0A7G5BY57_9BACL|nr:YafY family protein [Cohnella cholangitidis]QMV41891.1 YafY family transcriptional regulator [Cohnella cholangitidis]
MNKTDRMLAIILEIQRKGIQRAEDLATTFETSVRTIYRDVQALSEAGVPIFGAPGTGYSLMEGYFLPPVSFSADEAVALMIGADFIEQRFDREYGERARTAREKIEGVLPSDVRKEAELVRETMKLLVMAREKIVDEAERASVARLRRAILERRKVAFGYLKAAAGTVDDRRSVRTVRPYGLSFILGSWLLVGYCELRQEIRHFRLSRMTELQDLEVTFSLPPDFSMSKYVPANDRSIEVRVLASPAIADRVKESKFYFVASMEEVPEGVLVTLRVRDPEDVLHWVLGWGAEAKVLEPESLRSQIREEAMRMLERC